MVLSYTASIWVVIFDITSLLVLLNWVGFIVKKYFQTRGLDYILLIVFSASISEVLKFLFNRPRPTDTLLSRVFEGSSFPSTHTSIAFGIAFFYLFTYMEYIKHNAHLNSNKILDTFIALNIVFVFILAGIIAYLRILVGAHYLEDVFAGVAVGFFTALIFKYFDFSVTKV